MENGCENCKMLVIMTALLKDSNDTVKRLTQEKAKLVASTQIKIDFSCN
jgi:hypothetical protein